MIRHLISISTSLLPIAVVVGQFVGSTASAQDRDVFLANVEGRIAIGSGSDVSPVNADLTTRVFGGVMIPNVPPFDPSDYGGDDPGFFALPAGHPELPAGASALPPNTEITINSLSFTVGSGTDTLFFWNGIGSVDFQPISSAQPGVTLSLDPNPIDSTGANSGADIHPLYTIDNGAAGVPADGVYLLSETASMAGLADSERYFRVWLVDALIVDEDAAEELEESLAIGETVVLGKDFGFFPEAVEYLNDNLVVPEPNSLLLAGLVFVGLGATRGSRRIRRRRAMR